MKLTKCKLGELVDVTRGMSLSGQYYSEEGELIRLTLGNFNMNGGGFKKNTSKTDLYFTGPVREEFILKKGDIITPLTEQSLGLLGTTARIPESGKYIQSQDVALVRCKPGKIDPNFCYYLIASDSVKQQLSAAAQQTKIRHTSPEKIMNCTVWVPELQEQERIGALLTAIDSKIELNRSINRNLEAIIKDITDYLFLSKKEKLNTSSIGEIASIKAGGDCPKDFSLVPTKNCFIPIYSNGTVNEGLYGYTSRAIIEGRSITVAARGTIGFCVRRYGEYVPIIRLLSVCPYELGADTYLHQIISRMTFKKNGSVQQQLTIPELSAIRIPYPSKEDLLEYDAITFPLILQINHNKKENDQLCTLRDELLPLLMNGQVSVNSDLSLD
ncbi:MAG: restriction endonuclease subunit S [Bacteroidales bacterium]|nr:restriction endonuclease subunit S [Bacteroidales bacterium]